MMMEIGHYYLRLTIRGDLKRGVGQRHDKTVISRVKGKQKSHTAAAFAPLKADDVLEVHLVDDDVH